MSAPADADASRDDAAIRSLAALLPCGALLLGADAAPRFASARACTLLGVADEARLRARWDRLAPALGITAAALRGGAQPLRAGGTVEVNGAPRVMRVEAHATGAPGSAAWLVLLQRRDRCDSADAALIAASRADACQHVLAGLLHDLNGPLNNLSLTLALLSGTLARLMARQPDDAALERCRRYVDTLAAESRRAYDCARSMSAAVTPAQESAGVAPASTLLHDAHHALRHHASLHELRVTIAESDAGLCTAGNLDLLRLALIDLMLAAIDATAPGGEITLTPQPAAGALRVRIAAHAARAPADALRTIDDILAAPPEQWLGYVAARRILETHGGGATLRHEDRDTLVIDARMPLARA